VGKNHPGGRSDIESTYETHNQATRRESAVLKNTKASAFVNRCERDKRKPVKN